VFGMLVSATRSCKTDGWVDVLYQSANRANSAFRPSRVGDWIVLVLVGLRWPTVDYLSQQPVEMQYPHSR